MWIKTLKNGLWSEISEYVSINKWGPPSLSELTVYWIPLGLTHFSSNIINKSFIFKDFRSFLKGANILHHSIMKITTELRKYKSSV